MSQQYPLATLIVLFYRHEPFVKDTVAGALAQTYPNLEIIFSDDHSPDNTFEVLQEAVKGYDGPHKIILNRNEKNMGLVPHVNKLLFEIAHGDYLFLNGGDDISRPERVSWSMEYYMSDPSITAVAGSYILIDKDGKETGRRILKKDSLLRVDDQDFLASDSFMTGGAAFSFRKEVLNQFGKIKKDCPTEDSVLRFRSLLLGPTVRSSKVFLVFRKHDNNLSNNIFKLKTAPIVSQYLTDLAVVRDTLSPSLYQTLEKKVAYYAKVRGIQERESKYPRLFRPFFLFKYHLLRAFYLRSIR